MHKPIQILRDQGFMVLKCQNLIDHIVKINNLDETKLCITKVKNIVCADKKI